MGSLFSGVGGFDLVFSRVGAEIAWQCEIDKFARLVLSCHFPRVKCHEDIAKIGAKNLEPVDLVCGGFPCQDLSVAGRRAGLAGKRSGLWFEFARILSELRPAWVVVENVPGLFSSNGGRDFAVILHGLVKLGYGVAWRVLDSQYAGVPQRRRRVFIVGNIGSGRASQVLFESPCVCGNPAPGRETGEEVARSGTGGTGGDSVKEQQMTFVTATETGHGFWSEGPARLRCSTAPSQPQTIVTPSMRTGRGTLPVSGSFGVRRLMPVECERLQGFPDNWTGMCRDSQRYKQLGNAVTVPVVEWIARRIMAAE